MGCQSVTGKGQGMSNGKFKKENNNGCGNCNSKKCLTPEPKHVVKKGCYVVSRSGSTTILNVGSSVKSKGC